MIAWLRRIGLAAGMFTAILVATRPTAAAEPRLLPGHVASAPEGARAAGSVHSPMTRATVDRLRAVLARSTGRRDVFAKIGDSNTVSPAFLSCFAGKDVRLGAHAALTPTVEHFRASRPDGLRTSFNRATEAARVGWLSGNVLAGDPAPLAREIEALRPAFAVIMLGTNDNRPGGVDPFAKNLLDLVDRTLSLGVVPLLSTIPPRTDNPHAAARVPELNAIIRSVAAARQVPLMDLHAALLPLKGHGLSADGIHLQVAATESSPHGCWLTSDALQRGMNLRNLITLTALDRARRFLLEGEAPEPDPSEPIAVTPASWFGTDDRS